MMEQVERKRQQQQAIEPASEAKEKEEPRDQLEEILS
jgi:hypothetical protein